MDAGRRTWLGLALLIGVVYILLGTLFALPREHVQAWRLAAWGASAVAYATHLAYEHLRLRSSTSIAALHAALAVAIGGIGLALNGMVHSWATAGVVRPAWLLALVAWPAVTAVPAYLVALVAGMLFVRLRAPGQASVTGPA